MGDAAGAQRILTALANWRDKQEMDNNNNSLLRGEGD